MSCVGQEGAGVCQHADKVAEQAKAAERLHLLFHTIACIKEPPCCAELHLARNLIGLEASEDSCDRVEVGRIQ